MRIAFRKVWRDLWNNKGRTLLVVLSIAVGVMALGMTTASSTFLNRQMDASRIANHSPHARLAFAVPLGDDAVEVVANMPEVVEAEGWITANLRWKPALADDWQEATLTALADYEHQLFDILELKSGAWPGANEISVEDSHWRPYRLPPIGGTIYVEVNDNAVPLRLSGTLRDAAQTPPPYNPINKPAFYVSRDTAARLLGTRDFNHLRFTIPRYSREEIQRVTDKVTEKLKRLGSAQAVDTFSLAEFQDPDKAFSQTFLDGLTTILLIMAVFSMALSVTLVINTINAIVAQQITQIGIMKTIGGEYAQIVTLYLAGVVVYGLLSLGLAVPLGMLIGYGMSSFWLTVLNVAPAPFSILPDVFLYQAGVGLLTPLLAALWPILQGVGISVREAIAAYGLGRGRYGTGWLDKLISRVQGLPRLATLALRNTFRRAGRVALTELTLISAGAIFMMVVTTGYSFQNTFDSIWAAWGYDAVFVFGDFQRSGKTEAAIHANPNVSAVEMWIWMQAQGHLPGKTGTANEYEFQMRGVPDDTQMYHPALIVGRGLNPADGHALIFNQKLAQDMGVQVGDPVVINYGGGREATWTVVGTAFDIGVGGRQNTVFMRRDVLAADLHQSGRATVAQVGTREDTFEAQEQVKKELQDYFKAQGVDITFSVGQIENRRLSSTLWDIIGGLLQMMTLLVAIVGSIGLSGTLSINVMERRREIGVMRAVGASSADVALIFMGEGLLLGVISWAQAVPLSMLGARYFVDALGNALQFPFAYQYSVAGMWAWLGIIVGLSLAASWLPARRATLISVRESLAYE
jgi:putative ABC transport system permease protein